LTEHDWADEIRKITEETDKEITCGGPGGIWPQKGSEPSANILLSVKKTLKKEL